VRVRGLVVNDVFPRFANHKRKKNAPTTHNIQGVKEIMHAKEKEGTS
jgi:hypothetical protein